MRKLEDSEIEDYKKVVELYNSRVKNRNEIERLTGIKFVHKYITIGLERGDIKPFMKSTSVEENQRRREEEREALKKRLQEDREAQKKYVERLEKRKQKDEAEMKRRSEEREEKRRRAEEEKQEDKQKEKQEEKREDLQEQITELSKFQQFLYMVEEEGITDVGELAKRLGSSKDTVHSFRSRAGKLGLIKKNTEVLPKDRKANYKRVIELYNMGITDENELVRRTQLSIYTVHRYIKRAREEEVLIEEPKTPLEEVLSLISDGEATKLLRHYIKKFETTGALANNSWKVVKKLIGRKAIDPKNEGKFREAKIKILKLMKEQIEQENKKIIAGIDQVKGEIEGR